MKLQIFTRFRRLRELTGVFLLLASLSLLLALASYHSTDPSWNTSTGLSKARNLIGPVGAHLADLSFQVIGIAAWGFPLIGMMLAFRLMSPRPVESPLLRLFGYGLMAACVASALSILNVPNPYGLSFAVGGAAGLLISSTFARFLNVAGTLILLTGMFILSVYLVSAFTMATFTNAFDRWTAWMAERMPRFERRKKKIVAPEQPQAAAAAPGFLEQAVNERQSRKKAAAAAASSLGGSSYGLAADLEAMNAHLVEQPVAAWDNGPAVGFEAPEPQLEEPPWESEIPIRSFAPEPEPEIVERAAEHKRRPLRDDSRKHAHYKLPSTKLLNAAPEREGYDSAELKEIAASIKAKLEEFNVFGNIVQINPGPVVTTFEFKPDAGVKIAKITTLSEDLCLGLQAESILIERIPGKPTVGIEVPNTRREMISLRQILESEEFCDSPSRLTIAMGKDISGRIRISELEKMPHLLIAGSTGSGKSVMLNTLIMSAIYKSTPDEVRMVLVDPKRVELGIYDGIPHLLTPVITEPKKAVNALRNAVLEMERRLKLLASYGVRNIDQFNRKIRQAAEKPLPLFTDSEAEEAPAPEQPLPYILIVIDELADLMMLERAGVEESVIRLAQMARAVGIHLVLATQRPSVDVITGLIKANFPARISFRVATRVDSRTVLDVMGAEHLLGRGDMLFLPPGTSRLLRVHGAFVTENEIGDVVDFWRQQAMPDYDQSFLIAPPSADDEDGDPEEFDGEEDPLYRDAVRVVLEMGKASTSILQRRLRLGYGRAARILDMMQRDGIIGPPDGSRPREVLRRPDWLEEVDASLR
jgi:DNA segregation ATPase FtsK/SpoIIIE, S-DNA-T family